MLLTPSHVNTMAATPKPRMTPRNDPSLFMVVTETSGKGALRVPLSTEKPTVLGSSKDCNVVLPGQSAVHATIEVAKDGKTAIVKDIKSAKKTSSFLKAGDEFQLGSTTLRIEADENTSSAGNLGRNAKGVVPGKRQNVVKFAPEPIVSTMAKNSHKVGTPTSKVSESKLTANQLRNSTPHPGKFGVKFNVEESKEPKPVSSISMRHSTPHPAKSASFVSTSASHIRDTVSSEMKKQAQHAGSAASQSRHPLSDVSATNSIVYVPRDTIPASVRRFMASRAKKPANKAVRPFPEQSFASSFSTSSSQSLPLKQDIQKEGRRLQERRTVLLARLETFELDSAAYEYWTVSELEQRVWGLEEEMRRAAAEAILVESGHDPRDFVEYSADEIEDWLAREVVRKTQEIERRNASMYQGTRISFGSPASSAHEPSFAVFEDESKKVAKNNVEADHKEEQGETQEELQEAALADENDVSLTAAPSPIAVAAPAAGLAPRTILVSIPQPDPMEMTCEQIRAELKQRGLKVSGLKSVIAERLAQAFAQEANQEEFLTEGHEFLGKSIAREFESGVSIGTITAFLPAVDNDENSARFHIVHEDGDTEVLDFEDTRAAIDEASK